MAAEETGKKKWSKKKKVIVLIITVILILAAGTIAFLLVNKKGQINSNQRFSSRGMENMGEGVISASGLTSVAMQEETYELDFLETALYVEESYLSVGEQVEEGAKVFKVSEETLEKARKELENTVTEAGLAYRQGKIDYETGLLEAEETLQLAQVNQKYAQAEYDSGAAQAAEKVEELEAQVQEAQELVEEYTGSVNSNYYYTYYKVEELRQIYYDNFSFQMKIYEDWDIENLENTSGSSGGSSQQAASAQLSGAMGGAMGGGTMSGTSSSGGNQNAEKLSVYELLDELVQEEGDAYKEALQQYEEASAKAAAALDQATGNLADLQAQLEQVRTEYQQSLITCKADYETTLAESKNAQTVYDTTVQKLEETYAALEDAREEAEENQALFNETIGDGYFYTKSAGNIVMVGVREGSYLSGESLLMAYSDPETVTVSASVSQSDIAAVAVGDSAYVMVNGYGNYEGTVLSINPITQSQSKSSVTYQVTVDLEGDISGLESNLTAYVYFGMTDEMIQNMDQMQSGSMDMQSGDIPEGFPEDSMPANDRGQRNFSPDFANQQGGTDTGQ